MPLDTLVHAVHGFLDAEVMLEQRRTEAGDATRPHQALERAERQLSDALASASNVASERSLVVEAEAYLAAAVAFERARSTQADGSEVAGPARRLERAQQGLLDMLRRYAREAAAHEVVGTPDARRVLVGVDGSQPSGWAVETAGRLADDLGAVVRLIHVRPLQNDQDPLLGPPELAGDDWESRDGEGLLIEEQARLPANVESSVVERWGDAAVEIVNVGRRWQAQVGRSTLYLLDSNDPANHPAHRGITSELYGGGPELRLQQELVLGIAGWRLLGAVGLEPQVCHLNEGHAAFAVLERTRAFMADSRRATFNTRHRE